MAEMNPPFVIDGEEHPGPIFRAALAGLVTNPAGGVDRLSSLEVTALDTPAMRVEVSAGTIFVPGTITASEQLLYACRNDGTVELVVPAADPTNPRIDLVVARVYDSNYAGASNEWALEIVAGTPAGSPSAPVTPENSIVLAELDVAANETTITSGEITDRRISSTTGTAGGGVIVCTSSTRPSAPWLGLEIYETDTRRHLTYLGASLGWVRDWGTSWGVLGRSTMSVDMNPITTTISDVTSLDAVSLTGVPAGRLLKCTFSARYSASSGEAVNVQVADGSNTIVSSGTGAFWPHVRASQSGFASFFLTGLSGSVTLKPRVSTSSGNGRIRGDVERTEFVVEDIGPAPA